MKKNKGFYMLMALTALVVAAAGFDFFWEKKKEEKKVADSKVILQKTADDVESFELTLKDPTSFDRDGNPMITNKIKLKRNGKVWSFESPIVEEASEAETDSFVQGLFSESATMIKEAEGGQQINWDSFGLTNPEGQVRLFFKDGTDLLIQVSNRKNYQNDPYLRRNQEEKVLLGASTWTSKITKPVIEFRQRKIFRAHPNDVKRIKLQSGSVQETLLNQAPDSETATASQWVLESHPDWKLDQNKVREIVTSLSGDLIRNFEREGQINAKDLAAYKLDAKAKGAVLSTLEVGLKSSNDPVILKFSFPVEQKRFVQLMQPSAIVAVDVSESQEYLGWRAEDLRDHQAAFDFDRARVTKIEIELEGQRTVLKMDQGWQVVSTSDPQAKPPVNEVEGLLSKLRNLEVLNFLPKSEKLGAPKAPKVMASIQLFDKDDKVVLGLRWGQMVQVKVAADATKPAYQVESTLQNEPFSMTDEKVKTLSLETWVKGKTP